MLDGNPVELVDLRASSRGERRRVMLRDYSLALPRTTSPTSFRGSESIILLFSSRTIKTAMLGTQTAAAAATPPLPPIQDTLRDGAVGTW